MVAKEIMEVCKSTIGDRVSSLDIPDACEAHGLWKGACEEVGVELVGFAKFLREYEGREGKGLVDKANGATLDDHESFWSAVESATVRASEIGVDLTRAVSSARAAFTARMLGLMRSAPAPQDQGDRVGLALRLAAALSDMSDRGCDVDGCADAVVAVLRPRDGFAFGPANAEGGPRPRVLAVGNEVLSLASLLAGAGGEEGANLNGASHGVWSRAVDKLGCGGRDVGEVKAGPGGAVWEALSEVGSSERGAKRRAEKDVIPEIRRTKATLCRFLVANAVLTSYTTPPSLVAGGQGEGRVRGRRRLVRHGGQGGLLLNSGRRPGPPRDGGRRLSRG